MSTESTSSPGIEELERLRSELASEKAKVERLAKKTEIYDNERRMQITSMQTDVDGFVESLGDEFGDYKSRMLPIAKWAKTMATNDDPELEIPLATVLYCASARSKRQLEEVNKNAVDAEALSIKCKENETLKEEVGKLQKRISEAEEHNIEMDRRNTELRDVINKIKATDAKFDFNKITSREVKASERASADSATVAAAVDVPPPQGESANPVAAAAAKKPELLSFLMSGGSGGSRFMPSQSNHAMLSAVSQVP